MQFSKAKVQKNDCGAVKLTANQKYGMTAFGWVDGNPVHLLTTADSGDMASVLWWVKNV